MSAAFLVSFCNLGAVDSRRCLAVIEPTGERWTVELPALDDWRTAGGAAGLCRWGEGFMLALQNGERVLELNKHLDVVASRPARGGVDMHGLAVLGDAVAIASTGRDTVLAWKPSEPISPKTLISANTDADTLHINDLCIHENRLVACGFGPVERDGVRAGSVFDVENGASLIAGLREPHSVRSFGGALYVLESATGRLYSRGSNGPPEQIAEFAGYVRGLSITERHMVVGRSAFRPRSRARPGLERKPAFDSRAPADAEHAISGLYIGAPDASRFDFIDLSDVAGEIYDVLEIDMDVVRREILSPAGKEARVRDLVMLVDQLRATIRTLQEELARRPPAQPR